MSKIFKYFYIFSKLTTSIVFLFIIIIMGYLLFTSYQEIDQSKIDLDSRFIDISELINRNVADFNQIKKDLSDNVLGINKLKDSLNEINQIIQDLNINEKISELSNRTLNLEDNLYSKKNNNQNINIIDQQKIDNINSLIDLIFEKYKLGQKINEEVDLLENIISNSKQPIIEELRVLEIKKFYGLESLNQLFDESTENYVKNFFLDQNQNIVIKYLSKYISIRPSELNKYENNNLNIILQAKQKMALKDLQEALNLVLIIDNEKKYFYKWIKQVENYIDFESVLKKARSID